MRWCRRWADYAARRRRRFRGVRRARGRRGQIAEIEITGIDAVFLEERFDVDHLRFDGVAQHLCLVGDGRAAKEDHAGQQRREHETDGGKPQRMRKLRHAAEQVGHGVERDAEQHAREDQKQRRGEIPGRDQQRRKCDGRRCRRPISPMRGRCGSEYDRQRKLPPVIPFRFAAVTLSSNGSGIKRP